MRQRKRFSDAAFAILGCASHGNALGEPVALLLHVVDRDGDVAEATAGLFIAVSVSLELGVRLQGR